MQRVEERQDPLVRHFWCIPQQWGTPWSVSEVVEVCPFCIIEVHDRGKGVKDLKRSGSGLVLFDPDVVTDAHAGEARKLLATEPRHAPRLRPRGQADCQRVGPVAPRLQKAA